MIYGFEFHSAYQKIFSESWNPDKSITLHRYVSEFWELGLNGFSDDFRNEANENANSIFNQSLDTILLNKMKKISPNNMNINNPKNNSNKRQINNIKINPSSSTNKINKKKGENDEEDEKAHANSIETLDLLQNYLRKQLVHLQLKFAFVQILARKSFTEITPLSAVLESHSNDFDLGFVEYQNRVIVKANQIFTERIEEKNKSIATALNEIFEQSQMSIDENYELTFLDDCHRLLKENVYEILLTQLLDLGKKYSKNMIKVIQDAISSPSVSFKLDFGHSHTSRRQVYLPNPSDTTTQFDQELKYYHTYLLYLVNQALIHSEIKQTIIEPSDISQNSEADQNSEITLNSDDENESIPHSQSNISNANDDSDEDTFHQNIEHYYDLDSLIKHMNSVQIFDSIDQMTKTWLKYLGSAIKKFSSTISYDDAFEIMYNIHKKSFNNYLETNVEDNLTQYILKLNNLHDKEFKLEEDEIETSRKITNQARDEYDRLLSDLRQEIKKVESKFTAARNQLLDRASSTVKKVKSQKEIRRKPSQSKILRRSGPGLKQIPSFLDITKVANIDIKKFFQKKITDILQYNENARKELILYRVYKAFERIGVCHFYEKEISKIMDDRRAQNSYLWHGKRDHEEKMRTIEKNLVDAYARLTQAETSIEQLKGDLQEAQRLSSQELHLHGLIVKQYDLDVQAVHELHASLTSDANIYELLEKLNKASIELDELELENDELEKQIQQEIREPMKASEGLRKKINLQQVKNRTVQIEKFKEQIQFNEKQRESKSYEKYNKENELLKIENERLKIQIQELLNKKSELKPEVSHSIDTIFDPLDPKYDMRIRRDKKIIKPTFHLKNLRMSV